MISTLNCLFCLNGVDIVTVSSKIENTHKQVGQILKEVFTTLCGLLQLEFTKTNIWDLEENPLPFCKLCRIDIARLFKLREKISEIEKNIQQILIKFSTLTVESDAWERASGVPNPGGKTDESYNNKYKDLRQQIINRYSPSITLEQCESVSNVAGPVVVCETDCEHQEDHSPVCEEEDEALKIKEEETISGEYDPSSPNSHTSVKSLRIRNSSPEKPLNKINKLEIPIPFHYQVTLHEGSTYSFRNSRFTIEGEKITCLECGFKTHRTPANKDVYLNIRHHIRRWHIGNTGKALVPAEPIELVDTATKNYNLKGFRFRATNEGHLCLTCGFLSKYRPAREKRKQASMFTNIRQHIIKIHLEKECQICGDGILRTNLAYHIATKHAKEKPGCHVCGKVLNSKRHLYGHMKNHQKKRVPTYKFQCDRCGKKFTRRASLNWHVRTHTGEKPFVCEKCGRKFALKAHLDTHLPTHDKIRPFACKQCDWSFGANYLLTRHIKQVHEGMKPPPPKKRKKLTKLSSESENVEESHGRSSEDK